MKAPGSPEDMSNFVTAVIHEGSFDKLAAYIDQAKADADAEVIIEGITINLRVTSFLQP